MRLLTHVLPVALITVGLVMACSTSPTGRTQLRLVGDEQLSQMGVTAFTQMKQEMPLAKSSATRSYVDCVARAITAQVPSRVAWEVQTFESKDVNAFALPGGKIGVYTGLLEVASTQDQLAAVIGHEVAHVLAGHSASRVSNEIATQFGMQIFSATTGYNPELVGLGANLLVLLPFSRGDESEADILGLDYMARAGFDPRAAVTLWQNMARASGGKAPAEFMSTHPSNDSRIRDITAQLGTVLPVYQQARAAGRNPGCKR
ncbi:M48 family metallopeptidase [Flagellatimonas centrodinii]|uniref:M48 family metallopeptidase n=1 Tax=Flagellatimonas centrodinii TaxID=2806210 RepID=UPI001FEE401F|nr:M48 family metallopeptidase [Flagellatimonas centrodinii]ULQ45193.1 M48 family metallopeptidase [Flagellatimonas centrodinii]